MIVLGADTHKRSHTIAAVSAGTGELLGERTVQVGAQGFGALVMLGARAGRRTGVGVGGLPACVGLLRAVSDRARRAGPAGDDEADGRFTVAALVGAGSPTASTRSRSRGRRCAKAWMRCPRRSWRAPSSICACWWTTASGWSASASRSTTPCNGICTTSGPNSRCRAARCSTATGAHAIARRLARAEQTTRVRIASDELRRIRELTRAIKALEAEIGQLVAQIAPQLLPEPGFGPLTAAKLVGEIAGAGRFASDAKLARAAGVAPIPVSSANTNRHRLDRGGNRQINADHPPHRRHPPAPRHRNTALQRPQTRRRQDPPKKPSAASSATSPAASGTSSNPPHTPATTPSSS